MFTKAEIYFLREYENVGYIFTVIQKKYFRVYTKR